ncbi:heavy-metal-associated domain-containing protein [Blastococcus colisei]|uniref:Heavy-metal-associated domain-containing protein n=1 Tax=Blastococcus colisei TaxID=1564162 RepID=A0A543PD08_9ACTN|nr:multicopper oxidase domain-containing protein [Blastococcus colisei]TQN41959.1 heavy-metal-associated domain-containing protein [Blastococcus colisei]
MITFHVPAMSSRSSVRAISARVCDVAGVRTLEADLVTRTVRVTGPAEPARIRAALAAAGYAADPCVPAGSSIREPRTGGTPMSTQISSAGTPTGHVHAAHDAGYLSGTFPTDPTGLPEATPPAVVELPDGASLELRMAPVAKRLAGTTVRMLAYNGSVPGPTITVRQGGRLTVRATNDTDSDTTVHWHGLRLENKYDGVPHDTQQPIPPGASFTYRLDFRDPGVYWYHPHIREDYTQEMGLYGNILVLPAEPDYWPPVHRDVVLTIDDVLIEDGAIAPFRRSEVTHAAMGRFGNVFLVGGETDHAMTARVGEVVRLWLTNTANVRVFDLHLPGARMKLVGGDSGRVEREEFISHLLIAPSERAIVDVLFEEPGHYTVEHRTPDRSYPLSRITVIPETAEPSLRGSFGTLRSAPELDAERRQLDHWLAAPPDRILAAVAEMDDPSGPAPGWPVTYACPMHPEVVSDEPGRCPKCGMKLLAASPDGAAGHHDMGHDMSTMDHHEAPAVHDHGHGQGLGTGDGIEWEDDMVEVNRLTTPATMRWQLLDRTAGTDRPPVGWSFTTGDRVKIRLVNEMDSDHPMHHPFHLHGAGRFLVLSRDGVPEPNLVWKDTVLLRTGQTVDILFDVTNPGIWMAHCHIPEHMASGMMFTFTVAEGAGA